MAVCAQATGRLRKYDLERPGDALQRLYTANTCGGGVPKSHFDVTPFRTGIALRGTAVRFAVSVSSVCLPCQVASSEEVGCHSGGAQRIGLDCSTKRGGLGDDKKRTCAAERARIPEKIEPGKRGSTR